MGFEHLGFGKPVRWNRPDFLVAAVFGGGESGDFAVEHGGGSFRDFQRVSGSVNRNSCFHGFLSEFGKRIEAHGDQDGIAGEALFRARLNPELIIHLGDGYALHGFDAIGAEDAVGSVDGHAETLELVRVDFVASASGHGFGQANHLDSGLQGMIAGDEADVAATDYEEPVGGADEVAVHQSLKSARSVNPGQIVAGEAEELFPGPGGVQNPLG